MGFICHEQPMGPNFKWMEVKPNESTSTSFVIYEKQLMKAQIQICQSNILMSF